MQKMSLLTMIEVAICAAFAFVLDLLPSIKLSPSISISFAMVPVFIIAFRWGVKASFISGLLWGLLQIVFGDFYALSIIQVIIEYFIAFAFIGLAGFLMPIIQKSIEQGNKAKTIIWVMIATFIGSFGRYFWHFIAGFVFWKDSAPKGQSAVLYSFVANGTTMLGAFILCTIVLSILLTLSPRLIHKFA